MVEAGALCQLCNKIDQDSGKHVCTVCEIDDIRMNQQWDFNDFTLWLLSLRAEFRE